MLGSLVLGRKLTDMTRPGERVGVLLPSVQGVAVVIFGLTAHGRVPAMLNFTAGVKNLRAACEVGGIPHHHHPPAALRRPGQARRRGRRARRGRTIIYTEELRKQITSLDKIRA